MHRLTALLLLTLTAALPACSSSSSGGDGELRVVATTTQLADIARAIVGDRGTVTGILDPGVDPHDYEPTPSDAAAVAEADLVIESGVGLDAWIDGVIGSAAASATRLDASDGVELLPGDEESPAGDPHYWLDPDNGRAVATAVGRALASIDPAQADEHRAAAAAYAQRIADLDAELAAMIEVVPPGRRQLVTSHDAFGYFARHYGITVLGAAIPSLSTAAEADARAVSQLAATVRRAGVTTIFAEDSVDPRLERAIARSAGARVGPALFADTLGSADGPGGTYLGMLRANMERIVSGLTR